MSERDAGRKPRLMETVDCPKCHGKGRIPHFSYYDNGICFRCNGAGTITRQKRSPRKPRAVVAPPPQTWPSGAFPFQKQATPALAMPCSLDEEAPF